LIIHKISTAYPLFRKPYLDREVITAAINQGVVHRFIAKPWNIDELDIVVSQASQFPEKFRNTQYLDWLSEAPVPNIMQKDIKKFNDYRNDMTLGKIALNHGFITRKQLDTSIAATQIARKAGRNVSLENIMFEKELISSEDMGKLIAASRRTMGKSFGAIAVKDYGVKLSDIKRCLAIQAREFSDTSICRLIGDIVVDEKILTEEQKESIIIDMTYSEKEEILNTDSNLSNTNPIDSIEHSVDNKVILDRKKQIFFRQRAFDKLFCKVAINKNFVTESEILNILEEQLIHFGKNFEIKKIKEIMIGASIISENQANLIESIIACKPDLFALYKVDKDLITTIGDNHAFELVVSADEMEAKISLIGVIPENMTCDTLKYLLKTHGIIYGLANDIDIEIFLKMASENRRKSFVIAKGRPVKLGRNASIKYFFEDENARFGKELMSGRFDYRERGEIVKVTKGTILAQKIPLIQSVKGSTIKGIEIPAPIPIDLTLSCGKGAVISKDGLTITAEVDGRPDLTLGGRISVMHEKTVEGNVDFRTGNIVFGGDVNVNGSLLPGFCVTADNLKINDIDEGQVNVENNLIVKNNIINSHIKSGGNIFVALSIKNSTISARGDLVIEKEIINSTIITSGKVLIQRGRIISSSIHAANGIEVKDVGNETSLPCILFPGSDEHAHDVINKFNHQIDSEKKKLEELDCLQKDCEKKIFEQLNALADMSKIQENLLSEKRNAVDGKKNATSDIVREHINERLIDLEKNIDKTDKILNTLFYEHETSQNKAKSIQIKLKSLIMRIHEITKERNEFQKWYENEKKAQFKKDNPGVMFNGCLFAGTQIKATHCVMKPKENIKNSKIYQVLNNE
ncbi:MAG: DUF342 domain-containing protein, partial [Desulfamplus sp.]|nr:DUF342 domain-containing protein [Desulfamplus sp.]